MTKAHTAHTAMGDSVSQYWDSRYQRGGTSGAGSHGIQGEDKAAWVNDIIRDWGVQSVVDWGCGDGHIASRLDVPRYTGLDVSPAAIEHCAALLARDGWEWILYDGFTAPELVHADLALSLDVIYHLVEEQFYRRYMELLFWSADLVAIISSNCEDEAPPHIRHRCFIADVPREWEILMEPDGETAVGRWLFMKGRP